MSTPCLHSYSQKKTWTTDKFHPELSENRSVWKSDNQGLQKATFVQAGRVGGAETGPGGPTPTVVGTNREGSRDVAGTQACVRASAGSQGRDAHHRALGGPLLRGGALSTCSLGLTRFHVYSNVYFF